MKNTSKRSLKVRGYHIQAQAEVLLATYFCNFENCHNWGMSIDTDVKVNPIANKDIDLRICKDTLMINIEVKTPEQDLFEEGKFHARLAYRHPDIERAEENSDLKKIASMLEAQSGMETQILKTNDNKVKDYIKSANAKFCERNKESVNVLVIMCTSEQMGNNLLYLMNPHSGLITENTYDNTLDFSKIDYIVVSNAVEGIVQSDEYEFDSNDFSNYVTLIISPHKDLSNERDAIKFFYSVIPNDNISFGEFEKTHSAELEKAGIPEDLYCQFMWCDYLALHRSEFALNKPTKEPSQ